MKHLAFSGLFAIFLLLLSGSGSGEVVDRIAALVNNEVITLSEVQEAGRRLFDQVRNSTLPQERQEKLKKAQFDVLDQLIEQKLLDEELKNKKVEVAEREVDAAIEDILKENRLTENELKMVLARDGMTFSAYRKHIRDHLGKMRLINREIKSKVVVEEEEVRRVYKERAGEFTDPAEVKVQQIFLAVSERTEESKAAAVQRQARALLEKAKNGADFAQLARDHSQGPEAGEGGVLGYFKHGELRPELEAAAFSLKVGEVSGLLRTPEGWHIVRVLERKGGEAKPFAQVQNQIHNDLIQAQAEKKFKEWMKSLRARAYIEIRL